jgi:arylsulfatase A-like enzyme
MLVKWKKGERGAPRDARGPVRGLIDIAPTLIAQSGAQIPSAMQGVDLTVAPDARPKRNKVVFAEEDHEGNVLRAVRTETWKYIEANQGNPRGVPTRELFKIVDDPIEMSNVVEENAYTASTLEEEAEAQQRLAESKSVGGKEAQLSKAELEALCALGYMECEE